MLRCLHVYMKKGLLLVFLTAMISGVSIFINKYSVSVINPYIFTFLKNAFVALALGGIFMAIKERTALKNLKKKHKTMFIYVVILAAVFLKEKLSKNFIIGALLLMLGNLLLLKKMPESFGAGDALILAATFLWAIENVIAKYVLRDLGGKIVAWARMFFGSIFILGYLGYSGDLAAVVNLSIRQIGWTAITAGLLFGYVLTWYSGLKYVPVSVATAILMFGSTVTTALSLVNGANVSVKEIMAGSLIIAGLIIIVGFKYFLKLNLRKGRAKYAA